MEVKPGQDVTSGNDDTASIKLIHSSLHMLPQQIRFLGVGLLSNILFLTGYQTSLQLFEPMGYVPSTIYAVFYMCYIPVGHLLTCLFVFGWPTPYLPSLLSNVPIGLTSMTLGTAATGYLDANGFDARVYFFLQDYLPFMVSKEELVKEDVQGTYSGIAVMILTGVWTFVLTSMVMAPPKKKKVESKRD